MKALLICPADRAGVSSLERQRPLVLMEFFGRSLLEHWMEYLFQQGIREVRVLAADRPEQVRAAAGDGSRWGLCVTVAAEREEPSLPLARERHAWWLSGPEEIEARVYVADHFPGSPQLPMFKGYGGCFAAVESQLSRLREGQPIGLRELRPGVWVGLHAHISEGARLVSPCYIGAGARVKEGAIIGPMAVVEDRAVVGRSAQVSHSYVAPDTAVGGSVDVRQSFAIGSWLVSWRAGSAVRVPDSFLLGALEPKQLTRPVARWLGRLCALLLMELTMPIGAMALLIAWWKGVPAFRRKLAVCPNAVPWCNRGDSILYFELNTSNRWLRRWPQLWNVAAGEFCWVGNRPLTHEKAARLVNDYERRWLDSPIGLISLADSRGCVDSVGQEARAHAAYYAAQAGWQLNTHVLVRFSMLFASGAASKLRRLLDPEMGPTVLPHRGITRGA